MATHLDLQEQEQVDQLKAFWQQYGNLITWVLTLALLVVAGWQGWQWWQREQAVKASAMFDELDRVATAGESDKTQRVFNDLKERFPGTAFAQQGGLLAAKVLYEKGKVDDAAAVLTWVAEKGLESEYRAMARLRLAGVLLDQKKYDEALKQIGEVKAEKFAALADDRRGDVLAAQGKKDEAKAAYQQAWKTMDEKVEYRRLIEAKLTALGAAPEAAK